MPNRYVPATAGFTGVGERVTRTATAVAAARLPRLLERLIFGAAPGYPAPAIRRTLGWALRGHMAAVEADFDAGFYLRQMPSEERRRRAGRAPLLHYLTVGQAERRSPHPAFDPGFYRRAHPALPLLADPLRHYVRHCHSAEAARNECEPGEVPGAVPGRDCVLVFHHARGGGSSEFLRRYEAAMRADGRNVVRLRAVAGAPTLAVVDRAGGEGAGRPSVIDLSEDRHRLVEIAREHRVTQVLVNHVIDRPPEIFGWVAELCAELGCGYDVVMHDYVALCPRVDMITGAGAFCDAAPPETCESCVRSHGAEVGPVSPSAWRRQSLMFLDGARRLIAPSDDLAMRMKRYLPSRQVLVWHPEDDSALPAELTPTVGAGEPLRVATLGALNVPKGARVLRALAEHAVAVKAPLSFTVIGPSVEARALDRAGVRVVGRYRADRLDALIGQAAPHLVLLPAIWPETWSFVLTTALRHGLPVAAFDIGAPAERLRRLGRGHLLPVAFATRPDELMTALLRIRQSWLARP